MIQWKLIHKWLKCIVAHIQYRLGGQNSNKRITTTRIYNYAFWLILWVISYKVMMSLWLRNKNCFAYSFWIHYVFRNITMNSISSSLFHHDFIIFFENSLWIHYLLHDFTINFPWIYFRFRRITMTLLSASRFYYEFTILFPKSLWIHYFFTKSIWIHYLFR